MTFQLKIPQKTSKANPSKYFTPKRQLAQFLLIISYFVISSSKVLFLGMVMSKYTR